MTSPNRVTAQIKRKSTFTAPELSRFSDDYLILRECGWSDRRIKRVFNKKIAKNQHTSEPREDYPVEA